MSNKRFSSSGFVRWLIPLLVLGSVGIGAPLFGQPTPALVRLAIVVRDAEARQAGDLLTVELSSRKDIQLLERAEIDRVYGEQQLAAGDGSFLRLGQVLGADGVIVLELTKLGTNQWLGLSFVSVNAGVMLTSERYSWSKAAGSDWTTGVVRHLSPFISKTSVSAKDAVPISVVSLRAAVQTPEGRDLESQLTLLLNERLTRQRELFVLERRRMQVLTSEKELSGVDDQPFWSGSYLVEGMLDPQGYSPEALTLTARLVPPRGGAPQTFDLSCARTNPAAAIEALTARLLAALKLQSSTETWNAADEANRFFTDAVWAHHWGILAQAQAASESAWALGLHTEPVAALRIKAYAEAAFPVFTWSGNIVVPGLADPGQLKSLARALELFNRDASLSFTNGACLSEEWFLNGLHLFRSAAATLDGFYHWTELAQGHAAELVQTRSFTRDLLSLLDNHPPMPAPEMRQRLFVKMSHELDMFDLVKWNEGGLFFDRPEDSLTFFRRMLEKGYAASNLPRLVAWQWDQRKTLPKITHEFLDDLCVSTNPATRLGGLMLRLANTPFYPENTFHEREGALVNALWDNRDWVLATMEHTKAISQTEDILRHGYSDPDPNALFAHEPFATMRFRLEKEFLLTSTNFDNQRFQIVFPLAYHQTPPEQARDLAQAMEHLVGPRNFAYAIRDQFRARGGLPPLTTNAQPVLPTIAADEPLTARFVRWRLPHCVPGANNHLHNERSLFRNGRLWTMVAILPVSANFDFYHPQLCVAIDPQTGAGEEMPFPDHTDAPQNRFEVTKDALYVSFGDHLARYLFSKHAWDKVEVPIETGAHIAALGDKLYLTTSDSVLELDPATLTTKILGSARRQPAVNELDPMCSSTVYVYAREDEKLGVVGPNKLLTYDPATTAWSQGPELPPATVRAFKVAFLYPQGAVLRTENTAKWQVLAFWNGRPGAELLLETFRQDGIRSSKGDFAPGNPRWEWPAGFDLNASRILAEGRTLWILSPRKVWHFMGGEFRETARFADTRQATLFRYSPDNAKPDSIAISFESAGVEPFNPRQGGFAIMGIQPRRMSEIPCWIDTTAGLLFSMPTLGGHWLIPKAELESRLAAARTKTGSTKPEPDTKAAPNPAPTRP